MLRTPLYVLVALLACIVGCNNDNKSEVSGTVLLNGEPIAEGSINFIPTEGNTGPGAGAVIKDGKYHIPRDKGVTTGKNRVELKAFKESKQKIQDPTAPAGTLTTLRVPAFPPEFNTSSTLVRDVKKGSDTIDFDIKLP